MNDDDTQTQETPVIISTRQEVVPLFDRFIVGYPSPMGVLLDTHQLV